MSYTTTDLAKLEAAIAKGVTGVSFDGRRVEYRSLAEMTKLRDQMRRELGLAEQRPRSVVAGFLSSDD